MANGTEKRRRSAQSKKRPQAARLRKKRTARQRLGTLVGILGYFAAFLGLFSLAVGAVYLPSALSAQRADVELRQGGSPTVGVVVEIKRSSTPHARPGGGSTTYYPVTEPATGGEQTTWSQYQGTKEERWSVGQRLPLLYDPGKPERMVIDTPAATELLAGKVDSYQQQLLIGGVAAAVSVPLYMAAGRLDPSSRKKRKRTRKTVSPQILPQQK